MFPRKLSYFILFLLSTTSVYYCTQLQFKFDFNQFFPQGDDDLKFFNEFKKDFQGDDNFMLIAIPNKPTVFDTSFLHKINNLSVHLNALDHVHQVQSIANLKYPIKTPFGFTTIPALHLDDSLAFVEDKKNLIQDPRIMHTLINAKQDILMISMQTDTDLEMTPSKKLLNQIDSTIQVAGFNTYHKLGRVNFQVVLTDNQKREVFVSSLVSSILVSLVLFVIFRSIKVVLFSMISLGLTLLIFMGILGFLGRDLSVMSALYPVIIMIVATADIVHILSRYYDELRKGKSNDAAIRVTVKEIGLATFITSVTTAIGFATLHTSRLLSIREFGWNAALGVMLAFFLTLWLAILLFPYLSSMHLNKNSEANAQKWDRLLQTIYQQSLTKGKYIVSACIVILLLCVAGLTQISTNYNIDDNLPRGSQIAKDFQVFENEFSGFRPMELAVTVAPPFSVENYEVIRTLDSIEHHLNTYPEVNAVFSQATLYKSVAKINNNNAANEYKFPADSIEFYDYQALMKKMKIMEKNLLVSSDGSKTRISTRLKDVGADSIKAIGSKIDAWISTHTDTAMLKVRRTGTGLVMDKNSVYVTESLMWGLLQGILAISLLMAWMLRSWRMVIISFIVNFIPLLFAGALMGYFGIKLDAAVSVIFTVIYGIAADDTIHFLSRYKLCIRDGMSTESALKTTFEETGKPIIQTTVLLFFGFLVMLFSNNGPTFIAGLLMSVTLASAVLCDLYLLPILMRKALYSA